MKFAKSDLKKFITNALTVCFVVFAVFLFIYCISDIFTSRQTYFYEGENRILSKMSLVFLLLHCVAIIAFCFLKDFRYVIEFFKKYYYISVSFFLVILAVLVSSFFNKTPINSVVTYSIYIIAMYLFIVSFSIASHFNVIKKENVMIFLLTLFYVYLTLCLFFYFYTIGKPMASGNLRKPIISHIFFPCSLIPFFHKSFSFRKMLIIYLSFLPILILANKMSVLLVFLVYIAYDIFTSKYLCQHKKRKFIFLGTVLFMLVILLIVSNITKNNFLSNTFSFNSFFLESGRLQNWINILSNLKDFSLLNYLFGRGVGATLEINNGTAAHNDFIEFIFDFGIFGLIFFTLLVVSVSLFIWKSNSIERKVDKKLIIFYLLLFIMISTIFSNGLFLLFMTIGIECSNCSLCDKYKNEIRYEKAYWCVDI
jgi:hypothetical protein